jgi:hypothetical protein
MLRAANIAVLGVLAFTVWGYQPAVAGCDVVSATHSADTKDEALKMSRVLATESANDLRRSRGWKSMRMSAWPLEQGICDPGVSHLSLAYLRKNLAQIRIA